MEPLRKLVALSMTSLIGLFVYEKKLTLEYISL